MDDRGITERASFDRIRYAQAWEDADILTEAMGDAAGGDLVAICASGDNALALLLCNPGKVHAVDISAAQIECLNLRLGAYATLTHPEFLELMGARPSARRAALLQKALAINPSGIDPNFFYGEYLLETKQPDKAVTYLERALQAPARPGRQIADTGRREEARVLLEKVKAK